MGRHTTGNGIGVAGAVIIAVLAIGGAAAITGALASAGGPSQGASEEAASAATGAGRATVAAADAGAGCERVAHVVTASSFAPVLTRLSPQLAQGDQCVRLDVVRADGRAAAAEVVKDGADVWIPDDASWEHTAPPGLLAPDQAHGAGSVLATSPIFMVTDRGTAGRLERVGGSGDGMVGAGSVAEAVWIRSGMDASALALEKIVPKARTAQGPAALPTAPGEVGIVPEYALLPVLARPGRPALAVLPGTDHTAQLRFTWFPTARAVADPARAGLLDRLRAALSGAQVAPALDAAGLRPPGSSSPPTQGRRRVPAVIAAPLPVLAGHHVDHVFASWFRDDRRVNVTIVVDVSWSMSRPAPGSTSPLIDLVRDGVQEVAGMLPDKSRLGLWAFGSGLDGHHDYLKVLPIGPLTADHRQALASAVRSLQAEHTGTGLYDTTLAAYAAARDAYSAGASNQVMVFTDGINEDDPDSISLADLSRQLTKVQDPHRPVQLSVVLFGEHPRADELSKALGPVQAYVESLTTADQVEAMFIHLATGGLHGESVS